MPTDQDYRDAARRHLTKEGTIEIDRGAIVSKGSDEGAYVQAWVWVPNDLLDRPKEPPMNRKKINAL